jgi:hypothetical protein
MSSFRYNSSGTSSALTEIRKNRMIFANFVIQQQNVQAGSQATMGLENGKVADGSIITELKTGALYTVVEERDRILLTSASQLPAFVPSAPTILFITEANEQLIVSFIQNTDGGAPITAYEYSLDNGLTFQNGNTTSSPLRITGLTNGDSYTVILRAINRVGSGPNSSPVTATPDLTRVTFTTVENTTWTAPTNIFTVSYLVVAGGGGSGGGYDTGAGAGGGGGMVLAGSLTVIPTTTYSVTVGDGGAAGTSDRLNLPEIPGQSGENSIFSSIIALGGGGGWPSRQPAGQVNGNGGAAAVNPTIASKGGNGGGSNGGGGGGGGSSGAGGNRSGTTAGTGGAGTANTLSGSSVTYGIGGAGGTGNNNNAGTAGTSNTGNGAKGGGAVSGADNDGAKGGSGIVILVY